MEKCWGKGGVIPGLRSWIIVSDVTVLPSWLISSGPTMFRRDGKYLYIAQQIVAMSATSRLQAHPVVLSLELFPTAKQVDILTRRDTSIYVFRI